VPSGRSGPALHPDAWIFFVTFIAVIVNAIQSEHAAEARRTQAVVTARIDHDSAAVTRELVATRL